MRVRAILWLGFAVIVVISGVEKRVAAREDQKPQSNSESVNGKEPVKYVNPGTGRLAMFVGAWSVTETHLGMRGEVLATVKGTEEIIWILDRRAIQRTYTTSTDTSVFRAIGTLTWNDEDKTYQGMWFDNASELGPTTVEGEWDKDTRTMVFTVESSGKGGMTLRHKVVEEFVDPEKRVVTTYRLVGPEVVKSMEVRYKRTVPCPARLRVLFDN